MRDLSSAEKDKLASAFEQFDETVTIENVSRIYEDTGIDTGLIHIYALENGLVPLRYQRNIGTLGIEGQGKLLKSTALVIGLGGLGGNVLEQLARTGVGTIIGVDFDVFDETNLNRQILSSHEAIGQSKVAVAEKRVAQINTDVIFEGYSVPLDKLPPDVFDRCDIVFDGLDNIPDRMVLAEKCAAANVVLIHAAIAAWYAQIAIIHPTSKLMSCIYTGQQSGVEKKLGTPPFTAAAAASLMTAQGIKVLTNNNPETVDQIITLDLLSNEMQKVAL